MNARQMMKEYSDLLEMCLATDDCSTCNLDGTDKCAYRDRALPERIIAQFAKELDEKDEEIAVLKERIAIMEVEREDDLK